MLNQGEMRRLAVNQVKRQLGKFRFNEYDEKTGIHKKEAYRAMGERISRHSNPNLLVPRDLGMPDVQAFWKGVLSRSM